MPSHWSLSGSHPEVLYWQDVSPTVTMEPPLPGQSALLHIAPAAPALQWNHSSQHYGQADPQSSFPTQTIPRLCECCQGSRCCPQSQDGQSQIIPTFSKRRQWIYAVVCEVRIWHLSHVLCSSSLFNSGLGMWAVSLAQTGEVVTMPCDDSPITIF